MLNLSRFRIIFVLEHQRIDIAEINHNHLLCMKTFFQYNAPVIVSHFDRHIQISSSVEAQNGHSVATI